MSANPDVSKRTKDTWTRVWTEIGERWASFFGIVLSPFVLILSGAILVLIWLSLGATQNEIPATLQALLTVIISIFSGLLGALIASRWNELKEGGILVTRGKSAIRGLKLLLLSIAAVEQRIRIYIKKISEDVGGYEIMKNNYEELIERCNLLQEEAMNAIEEWEDIIPEANVKTQIGVISSLKTEQVNLERQIAEMRKKGAETEERSEEDRERIARSLRETERELSDVMRQLREKEVKWSSSVFGGIKIKPSSNSNIVITVDPQFESKYCVNCRDFYIGDVCPKCGKSSKMIDLLE